VRVVSHPTELAVIEDVWEGSAEDNLEQQQRGRNRNKEELNTDHHQTEENWHLTPSGGCEMHTKF
jgi:hypothetical protein